MKNESIWVKSTSRVESAPLPTSFAYEQQKNEVPTHYLVEDGFTIKNLVNHVFSRSN